MEYVATKAEKVGLEIPSSRVERGILRP